MPIKTVAKRHSRAPRHKHTKHYLQTYWPYLPMMMTILVGLILGGSRPLHFGQQGVLALATDMSTSGLLNATNSQRANNGKADFKINQQLINAAQAKANDMVARNYWSHNTPDGQQPWTFVQSAGYKYTKAGENLAYGFTTSSDTIIGWMNSQTHKDNLLDSAFTEVGFGIANSNDYNQSGPETVVVAMYGEPQVLAAATPAPSTIPAAPKTTAVPQQTVATSAPPADVKPNPTQTDTTVASNKPVIEPVSKTVTRAGILSSGRIPWLVGGISIISGLSIIALLVKHGWGFKRLLRDSEQFVLKHPLVDMTLVAIIMLGYVLSTTKGFIR